MGCSCGGLLTLGSSGVDSVATSTEDMGDGAIVLYMWCETECVEVKSMYQGGAVVR